MQIRKSWISVILLTVAGGTAGSLAQTPPPQRSDDGWKRPPEIEQNILVEHRYAGDDSKQEYFLMRKRHARPGDKHGLVVVLPGGPGSAEFLPFCANILTASAIPEDFLVAELVAPQWRTDESRVVWPSHVVPDPNAAFTTEDFLTAVVDEVSRKEAIDQRFVFTLGWSSSGHALYSASTQVPKVRGSVIAMSWFEPRYVEKDKLKGKSFYLYHSPEDRICPFAGAELAVKTLNQHGAEARLATYKGGHGWQPFTYYADRIMEGILWLKDKNSAGSQSK